jgi:hypothetical protein
MWACVSRGTFLTVIEGLKGDGNSGGKGEEGAWSMEYRLTGSQFRVCYDFLGRLHPLALPHHHLTLHLLCLFVRPFVCSFGWLLRRLSASCHRASHPVVSPRHVIALHLISCHPSHLVIVELSCRSVSSHLIPPLSSHNVDINALVAHLPRLDGIDHMARCLLGDVYECICFGLVTVNECVNFRLVMCHRTVLKFGKNNDKNNKQS